MKPILSAIMIIFLAGCGRESDWSSSLQVETQPWLRHPTPEEIASGASQEGSYLVAFKGGFSGDSLEAYRPLNGVSSRRLISKSLALRARPLIGLQSINLLGSLNAIDPSRSFTPKPFEFNFKPKSLSFTFDPKHKDVLSITKVQFSSLVDADRILKKWYDKKIIWYAEPNFISKPYGEFEDSIVANFSDGLLFPWLDQIDFIEAIQFLGPTTPTESPVIAVLDSGIDVLHPALEKSIFLNEDGQNQLCLDDFYGCDTTKTKKEILGEGTVYPAGTEGFGLPCLAGQSNCAHGTHVAGIVAARDSGYIGICPYCRILAVKVVGIKEDGGRESFQIEDSAIVAGLAYVSGFTVQGEPLVRVINASFGKFQKSRSVGLFIESLTSFGKGILTVAAAGNEDTMKRQYPAAFDDVLAVASVNSNPSLPRKAYSSNFGMWVDISAPGSGDCRAGTASGILSSIPGGGAQCTEGTSMASPVVAGVAGLILTREPDLDFAALRDRVLASAIPDVLYQDGVNNAYRPEVDGKELVPLLGGGVVNAYAALNTSLEKTAPIFTEKRDAVKPGCGSIGSDSNGNLWGLIVLLFPVLLTINSAVRRMNER